MAEPSGCIFDPKRGFAMLSWTGKVIFPRDIQPEDVCIEDIAHSLSLTCRFNGMCDYFYSTAQHSVLAFEQASKAHAREALLHDSSEPYVGCDFPRPYKLELPELVEFEKAIERRVHPILGIPVEKSAEVKYIDERLLATEISLLFTRHNQYTIKDGCLMFGQHVLTEGLPPPYDWTHLESWSPEEAERRFLEAYHSLSS